MRDFPLFDSDAKQRGVKVDLRSDTVTRPTAAMFDRMRTAPLGDDGLDGDPTVAALEARVAEKLGKASGLFVPTCTMANLIAVASHSARYEQVVLEARAHMYTSERGGQLFANTPYTPIAGTDGAMCTALLRKTIKDAKGLPVGLVCMETTHNNAGGTILSLPHMQEVYACANDFGVPVHVDGARLFNAAAALGVPSASIAHHADSVAICLSKGLSAPVGAVLVGSRTLIERARSIRKMLGGTQRQSGIVAAAGIEAIESMEARLAEDHVTARFLSERINAIGSVLRATKPQTNIVQVDVSRTGASSAVWVTQLAARGVLTRPLDDGTLRCVTHRHIASDDIDAAVKSFSDVLAAMA